MCCAGLHPIRYFEAFPDVEPFGRREGYGNKAEWIVDLTTKADREGKHSAYADRYDASELRRVNLKELDLQLDRGFRVRPCVSVCCNESCLSPRYLRKIVVCTSACIYSEGCKPP